MKRHELIFWFLRVPLDMVLIFSSFFLARSIREVTDLIPSIHLNIQTISTISLVKFATIGTLVYVLLFVFQGLYRIRLGGSRVQEIFKLIRYSFVGFFLLVGLIYFGNGFVYQTQIPRLILFFSFIISLVLMIFSRFILDFIQGQGLKRGKFMKRRVVVVIDDMKNLPERIIQTLQDSIMYEVVGYIAPRKISKSPFRYLGKFSTIESWIDTDKADEVFVLDHEIPRDVQRHIFEQSRQKGLRYKSLSNTFESWKNNTDIHLLADTPLIEIRSIGLTNWGRIIKRSFDIVVGGGLLLMFSPIILIFGAIAAFQSKSTPFYASIRAGKRSQGFSMYKIQSMVANADQIKKDLMQKNERTDGPLFKMKNDPRVTPIGRFIRKWDIDELPQLWNVVKGDMSLIGPRPHLPDEVSQYEPWQKRLMTIKPGITGMAQVNGRHMNTFEREVELDIFYIENWSLLLDTKVLLKTFKTVLFRG